jgi:pyrimidine-nucleoside phosphorylase
MKSRDAARGLGEAIRGIGAAWGKRVTVVLSDMDAPIGTMIGNALEVTESIDVLRGGGPVDTRELTVRLGAEMLLLGGVASDEADGARRIEAALDDGSALEVFRRVVAAQGGDPRVCDEPAAVLPQAPHRHSIRADRSGRVAAIAADDIGVAALLLGAGRRRKEDPVDAAVGVELLRHVGDAVRAGEPVAILHHRDRGLERATALVEAAFRFDDGGPPGALAIPRSRILEVMR